MESIEIIEVDNTPCVHIIESESHARIIPLAVLATWSELLGISDPVEVLAARCQVFDQGGEPSPDPATGESVWTDPFILLQHREQAREREALRVVDKATELRSLQLRTALAAHNAVHLPIDGGECAMDRCRRAARGALSLVDGTSKPTAMSRSMGTALPDHEGEGQAEVIARTLAPVRDFIELQRRSFLHALTGSDSNPLGDTSPPDQPVAAPISRQDSLAKYGIPVEETEMDPLEAIRQEWAENTERQDHAA